LKSENERLKSENSELRSEVEWLISIEIQQY